MHVATFRTAAVKLLAKLLCVWIVLVAAGLVGLVCWVVDNRLVRAAGVCVCVCVCIYLLVCVGVWLSVFGSTLIRWALIAGSVAVWFRSTHESHAAGQRLLLYCPEDVCVFVVFAVFVCDWARLRRDPLACWLGILSCRWEPVGVGCWMLFFPVASCPYFLSDTHIHTHLYPMH